MCRLRDATGLRFLQVTCESLPAELAKCYTESVKAYMWHGGLDQPIRIGIDRKNAAAPGTATNCDIRGYEARQLTACGEIEKRLAGIGPVFAFGLCRSLSSVTLKPMSAGERSPSTNGTFRTTCRSRTTRTPVFSAVSEPRLPASASKLVPADAPGAHRVLSVKAAGRVTNH